MMLQLSSCRRWSYLVVLSAWIALWYGSIAAAQIPSVNDTTFTPTPNAGHDYIEAPNETVNPANGGLSIRIGVPMKKHLGPKIPFSFAYDSSGVFYLATPHPSMQWLDTIGQETQGGWSYTFPMLGVQDHQYTGYNTGAGVNDYMYTCDAFSDYVFQDANGGRQNLGLFTWDTTNPQCNGLGSPGTAPIGNNQNPFTGLFPYQAITSTASFTFGWPQNVDVIDADGNDYFFGPGNTSPYANPCTDPNTCLGTSMPIRVTDRNGNLWQRGVQVSTFGANPDIVNVDGFSQPYRVNWTTVSASYAVNLTFFPLGGQDNSNCPGSGSSISGGQPQIHAVSSIELPNRQSYTFDYSNNPYGRVDKITYPTGGYVRYVWGLNPQSAFYYYTFLGPSPPIFGPGGNYLGDGPPTIGGTCEYEYDVPAIIKRFVSYDGTHEVEEQDFINYTTTWAPPTGSQTVSGVWSSKQTTVVTKDLLQNTQFQTIYTYVAAGDPVQPNSTQSGPVPVENQIQYYDTSGNLLRTVNKEWQNPRLLIQQTTTLNDTSPARTSETDWNYNCNEMLTEKDDYDFGTGSDTVVLSRNCGTNNTYVAASGTRGALLRKTLYPSYHTFTGQSGTAHIVDKPDSVQVQDSSGNIKAGVSYTYDGTINTTTGNPNANLLTRSNWLNSSGGSTLDTNLRYDGYGNINSTTDPQGNTTSYSYSDSFFDTCSLPPSNAYLTSITYPTTSNGVPHTESFKYWCATGELAQSTDENHQQTSYYYNDLFNRLTETDYPSGWGETKVAYNDTPGAVSVETKRLDQSGTTWADTIGYFDNMSHQVSQSSMSGETTAGWNHSDTCLDGLGQAHVSTYLYQSSSSAADFNCSHPGDTLDYDALGRTVRVKHSDTTFVKTTYTGRAVDVKDEGSTSGSIERISQSDALGRLIDVCEVTGQAQSDSSPSNCGLDFASPIGGFLTDYQYSAVGDLTHVTQGAVARSFVYDLTSRLTQATNPESGTINYTYDSDGTCPFSTYTGELVSKTDGLGKTCMGYDQLHRLTNKNYLDGVTPNATYAYDQTTAFGVSLGYPIGRMTSKWTTSGGGIQTGSIFSYDALGHVVDNSQCTPQNCGSSMFPVTYPSYNVLGEPNSSTNGAGVTLTYGYNAAGRLTSLSSNLNDSNHPGTLLSAVQYNAVGSPVTSTIGNGLTDTRSYDVRGRINTAFVGSASATPSSGSITVSGSEQGQAASQATGWVEIDGSDYNYVLCDDSGDNCNTVYDEGYISLTVGNTNYWYSYGQGDDESTVIPSLVASINAQGIYTATGNGDMIYITSVATGSAANVSLSAVTNGDYGDESFRIATSGSTLTGGVGASGTPDSGTVSVTANGITSTATYGVGDTPSSVATSLAAAINGNSPALSASAFGTTISLTSTVPGASGNYAVTSSSVSNEGYSAASFSATSTTLSGGTGGSIYSMGLARLPDGGIRSSFDSTNGSWSYAYDGFDRLSTAVSNTGLGCIETYDRYGNRLAQSAWNGSCVSTPSYSPSGNNDNRLSGFAYNGAGAITNDGLHSYAYDAEDRVTAVDAGGVTYVYDADGRRTAKYNGSTALNFYLYDLAGHVIADMPGNVPTAPSGYIYCANENGTCNLPGAATVAFGANGQFAYQTVAPPGGNELLFTFTGSENGSFLLPYNPTPAQYGLGDSTGFNPIEVTGVAGEFTIVNFFSASSGGGSNDSFDPNGYVGPTIYTGTEDHPSFAVGSYNLTGYVSGASETLTIASYTPPSSASIGCNNSVFGDPDPGVGKACFYSLPNANAPTGPAGYVFCSTEGAKCTFAGDGMLAYGANGNFLYANFTDGSTCSTAAFGGFDPAPGTVKACFYQQASSGRSEVYAGGEHLATYTGGTTYFTHSDWLGTERVRTTVAGGIYSTWTSSPFGEGEAGGNPGPTHFTGKERDTESGLDYFGARYYASNIGRFMSPDWSAQAEPVPYAKLGNPQTLNLYAYVNNNPLGGADPDGHEADGQTELDKEFREDAANMGIEIPAKGPTPPPAQQNGAGQNKGDAKKDPPNSNKDVVLASDEIPVKALRVNPFLYTTTWYAYEFKNGVLGKKLPHATISLSESMNGGPFQPTGDPSKGTANDQLMAGPPVNQRWSVNGMRVQLVMSKGADGKLALTWEAHIVRSGARPVYSSVP